MPMHRRRFLFAAGSLAAASASSRASGESWAQKLVAAALTQVDVTVQYDPTYAKLAYPGGDVPRERGVCTDVIIRAYRDAFGVDLQRLVHEDMAGHFAAYPHKWGLAGADANIDHRRVPNLQVFFRRHGQVLPLTQNPTDYAPGDLVTSLLPGALPHIMLVEAAPTVIHNIGSGARQENRLFEFPLTGHFRYRPSVSA